MSEPLTAIILTYNEAAHIVPCLRAVQWTDHRLVIHSGDDDDIPAMAAAHGARMLSRPFTNWPEQRNYALDQATTDWVLFVDVDERVTLDLAEAIRAVLSGHHPPATDDRPPVGYWIPRQKRDPGAVGPPCRLVSRLPAPPLSAVLRSLRSRPSGA